MFKPVIAAAIIAAAPSAAHATAIIDFDGAYGSYSKTVSGSFSFDFGFDVSGKGLVSASLTSTRAGNLPRLTFTSVLLNGVPLDYSFDGKTLTFEIEDLLTELTTNVLTIVGSGRGSFGGSVSFVPVGEVPEPASWAMMIAGFGLIGAAMRRRVTKVAFAA